MKKRICSVFLCICLLLPFFKGLDVIDAIAASKSGETKEYIIQELSHMISASPDISKTGTVAMTGGVIDAIDLSGKGDYALENVGIQVDTYVSGSAGFVDFFVGGKYGGEFEISSAKTYDKEERNAGPAKRLRFEENTWLRVVVPLSVFNPSSATSFDPSNMNYIRLFFLGGGSAYAGETGTLKLMKMCLVDLTVPEEERPTEKERPLGDGTFLAKPPVFQKMDIGQGYDQSVSVIAGYNLEQYLVDNPDVLTKDVNGKDDYSAVVNSLLDGLRIAGGGALFIPAGEWAFRNEIIMPPGTTIVGEWANPDENPKVGGTILKVYCGQDNVSGKAFVTMQHHTKINNVAFWYPEQTVDTFSAYPPTIRTADYTFVENVTLVNSYVGIINDGGANCPNAKNIYGTPLNTGVDLNLIIDVGRFEELHFSADYWAKSGLSGAPASDAALATLKDYLYNYAIGIALRRIDWSYIVYSDIVGYNIGLLFGSPVNEGNNPQGQCIGLNFVDCMYGNFSYGPDIKTMLLLDFTFKNCDYGTYLCDSSGENWGLGGTLQYYNADIQATEHAVYQTASQTKVYLIDSIIRSGRVYANNGNNIFVNNKIYPASPQIELDYGTISAVMIGNTDSRNNPIEFTNPGLCPVDYEEQPMKLGEHTPLSREQAQAEVKAPVSATVVIPDDLDTTGKTDMTEKIQQYLTELAQNGGGTLFLKPGKYRIDGVFTIPSGVELRGSADFGSIPKATNTILCVYTPIESGKDEYTSTATVTMEADSGIRGVIFNYPAQNPIKSVVSGSYEFDFVPYPYTFRGMGENVYIVNTTVRNGWNGVDFATNKCDNHYIDYLAGCFFNRGIVIGGGSAGGCVRNYQFNINSLTSVTADIWSGFDGVPSNYAEAAAFATPLKTHLNNNFIALQVGHVEDQLVYNCFNYAGYSGAHLIAEDTGKADVSFVGHAADATTVPAKIEAAESVKFVNLQTVAVSSLVDEKEKTAHAIWLTDTFEGEVTVINFTEWATCTSAVRVDNGTLNMYNAQFYLLPQIFELNGNGKVNVVGFCCPSPDSTSLVKGNSKNLHITAGFTVKELVGAETLGTYKYVHKISYRYSPPKNVVFPEDAEILAAESFDDYVFSTNTDYQVSSTTGATIRRGAVRMRLGTSDFGISLNAGQTQNGAKPFVLSAGTKKDLYRMEWRLNIASMLNDGDITINLSGNKGSQTFVTIKSDGSLYDQTNTKIETVKFGTDYRLAIEIDARNANKKTSTLYLLDDNNRVIAKGATVAMDTDIFQGEENAVTGFVVAAWSSFGVASETETDVSIDYFYVIRSEESTIGRADSTNVRMGDVNGDNKVNSTDARFVLQYAVGKISTLAVEAAADVNGDNKVNSTDARLILQYAVGKIQSF